jgi:hypothetical protein
MGGFWLGCAVGVSVTLAAWLIKEWRVLRSPPPGLPSQPPPVVWAKSPAGDRARALREEKQGGRRPRVRQARFSRERYLDGGG